MLTKLLPVFLLVQAVIGAVDTLLNHELIERLPRRPEARTENGLHALREINYAALFGCLAWFAWHGSAAFVIGLLLAIELGVTLVDEFVENRIRVLPQNERVLHVFLMINLGILTVLLVATLSEWVTYPIGIVPVNQNLVSWLLSAFALSALIWSVRDALAWRRLKFAQH